MNRVYSFTEKSLNFWLNLFNLFSRKNEEIETFCRVEYGNEWQWAYSHYQKTKTFPSPLKQAA